MPASLVTTGLDDILIALGDRFSKARVDRIVNSALRKEAGVEVEEIKSKLESAYKDTGISAEGVVYGNVSRSAGYPVIKVGNSGEHWRLIHLNENGFTKNGKSYTGAGHGMLRAYVREHEKEYAENILLSLGELLE